MNYDVVYNDVTSKLQNLNPHGICIVFDIDETLLTNTANKIRNKSDIFRNQRAGNLYHIPYMTKLYTECKNRGFTIALITGRTENLRDITLTNLGKYMNTDGVYLYMKPKAGIENGVFKSNVRKQICDSGYRIIANIGDQPTDLEGGYYENGYLLPSTY